MAKVEYELEGGPPQPYHLVNPSPWPLLSSFSIGIMALGGVFWMNNTEEAYFPSLFVLGMALVIFCMIVWWRDVIREHVIERAHSAIANIGFRFGMALFIASEVMFFVAFFWAFFNASLFPVAGFEAGTYPLTIDPGVWPPEGIETVSPWSLPLLMTFILLLSGQTVTIAHAAMVRGDRKGVNLFLGLTVGLGVLFTAVQIYEYTHVNFGLSSGAFGSTFMMATGFHGFHVIVGTIFLAVCWWRNNKGHFTPDDHFGFEAAAWYWHFVDVVWLFLFAAVYVWGSIPNT